MASIMDLISSLFKKGDSGEPVPIDPLTYNIMHKPVSYANQDGMPSNILAAHYSGDRGQAILDKYKNPIDTEMAEQYPDMGAESNPEPVVSPGVDVDIATMIADEFKRKGAQKLNPVKYPPGYTKIRRE